MIVSEVINEVAKESKKADKLKILKENRNEVLDWVFKSSKKKFGLTSNAGVSINVGCNYNLYIDEMFAEITSTFEKFEKRELTGNAAIEALRNILINLHPDDGEIIFNILDGNLKCGVSFETYETKVMGLKSSKFEVTLAEKIQEHPEIDIFDGDWFMSRKCDGVRCVAFVDTYEKTVKFISRQGKEFTNLENLKPEVLRFCSKFYDLHEIVLDGELCKIDANGNEVFSKIQGACRSNDQIEDCCYQLFDIVPTKEFLGEMSTHCFGTRYGLLRSVCKSYNAEPHRKCFIKILEQEKITSEDQFHAKHEYALSHGWEGLIVRKDIRFKVGRSADMLKVKKYDDNEFKVVDLEINDKFTMNESGKGNKTCRAVAKIVIDHNGNKVGVGSGLTFEQRLDWVEHPEHIIGKVVTIQYFGETVNKKTKLKSLRHPVLKCVYENGRDL